MTSAPLPPIWITKTFGRRWEEVASQGSLIKLRDEKTGREVSVSRPDLEFIATRKER